MKITLEVTIEELERLLEKLKRKKLAGDTNGGLTIIRFGLMKIA